MLQLNLWAWMIKKGSLVCQHAFPLRSQACQMLFAQLCLYKEDFLEHNLSTNCFLQHPTSSVCWFLPFLRHVFKVVCLAFKLNISATVWTLNRPGVWRGSAPPPLFFFFVSPPTCLSAVLSLVFICVCVHEEEMRRPITSKREGGGGGTTAPAVWKKRGWWRLAKWKSNNNNKGLKIDSETITDD